MKITRIGSAALNIAAYESIPAMKPARIFKYVASDAVRLEVIWSVWEQGRPQDTSGLSSWIFDHVSHLNGNKLQYPPKSINPYHNHVQIPLYPKKYPRKWWVSHPIDAYVVYCTNPYYIPAKLVVKSPFLLIIAISLFGPFFWRRFRLFCWEIFAYWSCVDCFSQKCMVLYCVKVLNVSIWHWRPI